MNTKLKKMVIICFIIPIIVLAQSFDPVKNVQVNQYLSKKATNTGEDFQLLITLKIPEDLHITKSDLFYQNLEKINSSNLKLVGITGLTTHKKHPVYKGEVGLLFSGKRNSSLEQKDTLMYGYQICSEVGNESCFMPVDRLLEISYSTNVDPIKIKSHLKKLEKKSEPSHEKATTATPEKKEESSIISVLFGEGSEDLTTEERLAGILEGTQTWTLIVFIIAFLGGILDSLTPCVYPVIPVVISYMGAKSGNKKSAGFVLSLFFVLGLAITYSVVGLVASFFGGIFGVGDLAANPIVRTFIAVVFFILALSMFGVWDMNIISAEKQTELMSQGKEKKGLVGAIFLGAISGIIAAPCVGPVLAVLLMHVASAGDVVYGFLVFMTFAFGLGILFIIIGTFSGAINALPQAGAWMMNIKKFFGVVMIGAAFFFISILLPDVAVHFLMALLTMLLAIFIGAFKPISDLNSFFKYVGKAAGILLITVSVIFTLKTIQHYTDLPFAIAGNDNGAIAHKENHVEFYKTHDDLNAITDALNKIQDNNKLVLVDMWAEWCGNCVELDKVTWNQPEVIEYVEKYFIPVKLDFTDKGSQFSQKFIQEYKEYGATNIPLILILDKNGKVLKKIQGLVEGDMMLKKLKSVVK